MVNKTLALKKSQYLERGYGSDGYEEFSLTGYDAILLNESQWMFLRNI
jgi:hypothetical protein